MIINGATIRTLTLRFCTAMRFLTLVPISWRAEEDVQQFADSLPFFVVVGMVIGSLGSCGIFLLSKAFPQPVIVALSLGYLAFISGCLHLDGLSDSADGLLSSRPREASLKIMKDSRAGAMGIIAVVLVFLLKYAALSSMSTGTLMAGLFLMPVAGRTAILLTMASLPYAREEGGLGNLFYTGNSKKAATLAIILFSACAWFFVPEYLITVILSFFAVNFLFNRWCKKKLGGATGDTLGAVCEITEMIVAVALTASLS